jgi:LDH2 family malate/lactate/ureidoglycolate dehydrogenase
MTDVKQLPLQEIRDLALSVLERSGYGEDHARAIADMLYTCQLDDCQSHGLFRLFMCQQTMDAGKIDGHVQPRISTGETAIVRADAQRGMSLLALEQAVPELIAKARKHGSPRLRSTIVSTSPRSGRKWSACPQPGWQAWRWCPAIPG